MEGVRIILSFSLFGSGLLPDPKFLALNSNSFKDLSKWEKDNIPYTIFKKRQEFFKDNDSQKSGIEEVA